jgi:hypothetical protein
MQAGNRISGLGRILYGMLTPSSDTRPEPDNNFVYGPIVNRRVQERVEAHPTNGSPPLPIDILNCYRRRCRPYVIRGSSEAMHG